MILCYQKNRASLLTIEMIYQRFLFEIWRGCRFKKSLSFLVALGCLNINIFLRVVILSSYPGSFDIVSFYDFLFSVKNIGHDNKVTLSDSLSFFVLLDQLVQSVEFSDESIAVLLEMVIIIFKDGFKESVLFLFDRLEHIFSIGSVIEKGTTFSLRSQLSH